MGFPEFDVPGPLQVPPCGANNLLRRGMHWLTHKLKEHASEQIVYVDRLGNRIACRATLGTKLLKIDDPMAGFRIEMTDMDFLIETRQLRIALEGPTPVQIIPTRGDQILLEIGGDVQTFEVSPYNNEPPWRWSDPHQSMMRIHAKLLEIEPYS